MSIFLSILILIVAVLLTLIVVVQNSKGGGLAAGFGDSNKYMGVRKTTDFLEKATWTLAGILVVLSITTSHFMKPSKAAEQSSTFIEQSQKNPVQAPVPAATLPGLPAADQPTADDATAPAPAEEAAAPAAEQAPVAE